MTAPYTIRPAVEADLPLLAAWRARPHVARWWGDPSVEPAADTLRETRVAPWIGVLGDRPFAFLQDYAVADWLPHHFGYLPPGSRGLDLYVGEPDLIGRGHGSALLAQHADALFARGVPALGIDPHPDNAAAIRAFRKAGFAVAGGPRNSNYPRGLCGGFGGRRAPAAPSLYAPLVRGGFH